ncbi:MAG: diguanylate cyclase [Planctomycetota bacterium]
MFKIKSAARLAITVALIVSSNLSLAMMMGLLPDLTEQAVQQRVQFAELIAINSASLAENNRLTDLERVLEQFQARNEELLSLGIRKRDGSYRLTVGEHKKNWKPEERNSEPLAIEIKSKGRVWGTIELRFSPLRTTLGSAMWGYPLDLILYVSAASCLLSWFTLSRTFRYLDPSKVVPNRVRSALDSLAEGLVLIDRDLRIVHANQAFAKMVFRDGEELVGNSLNDFKWNFEVEGQTAVPPWTISIQSQEPIVGRLIEAQYGNEVHKYKVNTNPIAGPKSECRGVLISFDDVTQLEQKKNDLANLVATLEQSRDEIQEQNAKLQFLASRDPLTKCYNRRTFWELFEKVWETTDKELVSMIMLDIDFFKQVNDNHGHSKGDDVLRETGALLLHLVGDEGIVCRFGGEEFAVLLYKVDLDGATRYANAFNRAFQRCKVGGLNVTCSVGLSNRQFRAMDSQHLLDQADQCLYAAKRNGRNQVVRFDQSAMLERRNKPRIGENRPAPKHISYSSVMALFTALAYHDQGIASQSQRIADTCLALGRRLLDPRTLYWMEVCALLQHVSRLAKKSSLPANQSVDSAQATRITVEILRNTFGSEELVWIMAGSANADASTLEAPQVGQRLDVCHRILGLATELVVAVESGRQLTSAEVEERLRTAEITADETVVEAVLKQLKPSSEMLETKCRNASVDCAVKLSPHVDDICISIANRDLSKLKSSTRSIAAIALETGNKTVKSIVESLEQQLARQEPEYEQLSHLADRIMELCRSTRHSLIKGTHVHSQSDHPEPFKLSN